MATQEISQKNVADYYDDFAKKQIKTGLNLRHYKSFTYIKKSGLKKNHRILEVGCGIGTFTKLLLGYVKKGSIVGTDISPTNIDQAKKRLSNYKNAEFVVTDMIDYSPENKFDYIVMLDVLEHIPVDQHANLFKTFRKVLKEDGTIFINIPHHNYLDYIRKHEPERMQIIDQSLSTDLIFNNIYNNDLRIVALNSHSIFYKKPDYQRIVLKPNEVITEINPTSKMSIIIRKMYHRIKALLSNL